MRKYEVLNEHEDINLPVGAEVEMDDYAKECTMVELGFLKSLNEHVLQP